MNKLWVRLTLAFALVTLVGLTTVAFLTYSQVNTQFRRFVAYNQISNPLLLATLTEHYASQGGWSGVDATFEDFQPTGGMGPRSGMGKMWHRMSNVVLADNTGHVVYDRVKNRAPLLSRNERDRAVLVELDGKIIGYLVVRAPDQTELTAPDLAFLRQINRSLIQAGLIAGGLGILLGLIIARSLTAPLGQLAAAARQISRGKFDQRVPVEGTEEVADLARAFNEMTAGLEQAEILRRNMVADVAHELRTPLSVLQGNLRAILDDVYPLEKAEITRLYDQTRLLSRLINDLRELAQAEAGQLELNRQAIDLTKLLQDTVVTFSPIVEAEEINLNTHIPAHLPPVRADSARIAQVLHNLMANALRHTPAGGVISLQAGTENGQLWLSVQDTGEGISAEDLPHVFDRFYRSDRARSRATGGSGLGLAIARVIVEAHGGQINAASDGISGHGSTFTVRLPLS
jgi:two-component system OmpR family sensor kinase/two-component system sensor histidine kinase BaeS